jgi:ubiquinone/menaquinone biosynthesis C-methylase UbiE
MEHRDHVALLAGGVRGGGPSWADLGSGEGAFTLALADLLGSAGEVLSVDIDRRALAAQRRAMERRFPAARVTYRVGDFTTELGLSPLDGIVMANSLHFVADKAAVLAGVAGWLRPGGRLVLVEYDTDHGNRWVPYPVSFHTWERLASSAGFDATRRLQAVPSRFLGRMYSAVSTWPGLPRQEAGPR